MAGITWYRNKWMALVAGIWIMSASGLSFDFSMYSSSLKRSLHYTQQAINGVATASNVGNGFGFVAAILSTLLPEWALLVIGIFMNTIGYGTLWLVAGRYISPLPFYQILFYQWLATTGATLFNTAVLMVCAYNMPHSRGSIVGLLMGMVGLSGALYAQLFEAAASSSGASFLLLLSVLPSVTVLISTPLLRPIKPSCESRELDMAGDHSNINKCFALCSCLALYLTLYTTVASIVTLDRMANQMAALGTMLILLALIIVPLTAGRKEIVESPPAGTGETQEASGASKDKAQQPLEMESDSNESSAESITGEEYNLQKAFSTLNFWLLFVSMLCGAGSTTAVISNLDVVVQSLGYSISNVYVLIISISNFMGQTLSGFYSDYLLTHFCCPRSAVVAFSQFAMIIAYLLLAYAPPGIIFISLVVIGVGLGATVSLVVSSISELFGLKNLGVLFNVSTSALGVGSYLFATKLAGYLYDLEASYIGIDNEEVCDGSHCFFTTFVAMAVVSGFGVISNLWLVARTKGIYQNAYEGKQINMGRDSLI